MRTLIRLPSPESLPIASLEAPVALVLNGQDVMNSSLPFLFYDDTAFAIKRVHPLGGPKRGGTVLTVYLIDDRLLIDRGGGFLHGPRCRFTSGTNQTQTRIRKKETAATMTNCAGNRVCGGGGPAMACPTPDWSSFGGDHLSVVVEVSLNGQQFSSGGYTYLEQDVPKTAFQYYNPKTTRVETVSPLSGPTAGNTSVVIAGFSLVALGDVRCRFGTLNQETDAQLRSEYRTVGILTTASIPPQPVLVHTINCPSPRHWAHPSPLLPHSYDVEVTLNGQQYLQLTPGEMISSSYQFTYFSVDSSLGLSLDAITPQGGPRAGGTRVTVRGSGFDRRITTRAQCRYGDVTVNASFTSEKPSDTLMCESPALGLPLINSSAGDHVVSFAVGINGQAADFTSGVDFVYHAPLQVSSIHPRGGSVLGATPITVYGEGFRDLDGGAGLQCIFGSTAQNVSVPATLLNDAGTALACTSPSLVDADGGKAAARAAPSGVPAVSGPPSATPEELSAAWRLLSEASGNEVHATQGGHARDVRVTNNRLTNQSQASLTSARFSYHIALPRPDSVE